MYFYKQTETNPDLWTVGHTDENGNFEPDSDHHDRDEAVNRVRYLNGGTIPDNQEINIAVVLKGGLVQECWADRPNVTIHKVDLDDEAEDPVHISTEKAQRVTVGDLLKSIRREYNL